MSARLRRQGEGKDAEMEDVLKVAKKARQAAEIYAQEKLSVSKDQVIKRLLRADNHRWDTSRISRLLTPVINHRTMEGGLGANHTCKDL